ncbi:hypothetical protein HKX48_002440 [Thoreauomyces humboldtii]|nr:hypothetical protein HKX48_002440 [Thoreauomyces humboldtii]
MRRLNVSAPRRQFGHATVVSGSREWVFECADASFAHCLTGYRLKSKCSSERPQCATCTKARVECSYTARERGGSGATLTTPAGSVGPGSVRRAKKPKNVDAYVQLLEERLAQVESLMGKKTSMEYHPAPYKQEDPTQSVHPAEIAATQHQYPQTGYQFPVPRSSDDYRSSSGSAQPISPVSATESLPPISTAERSFPASSISPLLAGYHIPALFAPDVLYDAAESYFGIVDIRWYNLPLHPKVFWSIPFEKHPPFLLYAMAASAAQYSTHPAIIEYARMSAVPGYRMGLPFFIKARDMVGSLLEQEPSVDSVIGLGLLGLAAIRMGESSATAFVAMAIRMAVELKLDIDPDVEDVHGPMTWVEKESRRRVWWSLCSLDITDCSGSDRARIIADRDQPLFDRTPFLDNTGRLKAPAPDILWKSIETADALPAMGLFVPGRDLDCAQSSGRLTRIYSRIQRLGGAISNIVHTAASSAPVSAVTPKVVPMPALAIIGNNSNLTTTADNASRHIAAFGLQGDDRPRQEVLDIEADLESWIESLPDWARSLEGVTTFTPLTTSRDPIPYQLLSLHIQYHACHVALHIGTLLRDRRRAPPAIYASTLDHTRHCTSLFRRAMVADPAGRYMPLTNCFYAFYPAVAVALFLCEGGDDGHEARETWKRDFEDYLNWMKVLGSKWFLGEYLLKVLEDVLADWAGIRESSQS